MRCIGSGEDSGAFTQYHGKIRKQGWDPLCPWVHFLGTLYLWDSSSNQAA